MFRGPLVGSLVAAALATALGPGTALADPEIGIAPDPHSFGNQPVNGGATGNQTFTISNTGSNPGGTLTISSMTEIGADCGDFNLSPFTGNISPGESENFTVSFDPSVQGSRSCIVRVANNDSNEANYDVNLSGVGTARVISLSPSPVAFGNVVRNTNGDQTLTISNTGNVTMQVTDLAVGGAQGNQFSVAAAPGLPFNIAGGASQNITLRCTPTSNGAKAGSLTVSSNADSGSGLVNLSCTGVDPQIAVAPTTLAFADTNVGGSSTQTFTVSNGVALNSSTLTYYFTEGGTNPADFAVTGNNCTSAAPCTLLPGNSRLHTVTFTPLDLATRSATLTVVHDDQDLASVLISMSGTGRRPEITLVQPPGAAVDFGDVPVDSNSTQATVTVRNDGNASLVIDAVTLTGSDPADFVISGGSIPPPSVVVAPGATASWTVRCHPTTQGLKSASFRIDNNDDQVTPEDPLSVSLTCRAVRSSLVASPSPIEFADTRVGASAEEVTVTLTNTGDAALTVHGISISSSAFPVSSALPMPDLPFELAPGGSTELAIGFQPTLQTEYAGTITLQTDTDVHTVPITGRCTLAEMSLDPAPFDFGPVALPGDPVRQLFTISSSASAPFQLGAVSVDEPDRFAVTRLEPGNYPAAIDPGGTATFEVAALPGIVGRAVATLTLTTNISSATLSRTRLTATGTTPDLVVSENAIDFGPLNLAASQPARRTVTVTNSGVTTLTLSDIRLSGPQAEAFTLVAPPPSDVPVAVGADFDLEVEYEPTVESIRDLATLEITTDALTGANIAIPLAGRGAARDIQVTPLALDFAETYRNPAEPAVLRVTVANRGTSPLTLDGISGTGAATDSFTMVGAPAVVGVGGEETITVAFAPTAASTEPITGSLVLARDGSGAPAVRVDLSGVAVLPNVAMAPGVIDLGSTGVGVPVLLSEVAPDLLQVINQDSDEAFTVAAVRVADMDGNPVEGGPFTVVSFTPMSEIAPGAAMPIDIEFIPDREGDFEAVVELYIDADPTRIAFVTVRGHGTDVSLRGGGGCGCTASSGAGGAGNLALVVLVLVLVSRRRRAR